MSYGFRAMLEAIEKKGEENYGKKCLQRLEQYKTKDKPISNPLASIPLQHQIEQAVEKAFKPIDDRLKAIEAQANITRSFDTPTFNGQRTRLDRDMNQSRICYD